MKKPFRIAIMMTGGRGWIGGTEYTKNLVLALGGVPAEERKTFELSLIVDREFDVSLRQQLTPCLDKICLTSAVLPQSSFLNRFCRQLIRRLLKIDNYPLYNFLKKNKFDFVYPFFAGPKRCNDLPCATWIPDFQHKYLQQYFTAAEIEGREESFDRQARFAEILVLSSNAALEDYHKFYPDATAMAKVLRFTTCPEENWFSVDPKEVQRKYNLPDRFFIISNQFWQHKNHLAVFDALKLLNESGVAPVVVCTGHIYDYRNPAFSDKILAKIHQAGLADQIKLLGLIPRLDQLQLMRRSVAVIQPSLFEGWSTVVEDARVLGKTMVLSDFAVHVEQNPSGARFFTKDSSEDLARVLDECWQSLPAGPSFEQETISREKNREELVVFARDFLAIARDVRTLQG